MLGGLWHVGFAIQLTRPVGGSLLSLGQIALEANLPVLFGVLTCNTLEQAIHRSGGNVGNKGVECALAALEMVRLLDDLP